MTFSTALYLLKEGRKLTRKGWNGKGIYIAMCFPSPSTFVTQPFLYIDTTALVTNNPHAPKGRVPWLASQTDLLAEDWTLMPETA